MRDVANPADKDNTLATSEYSMKLPTASLDIHGSYQFT